MFRWLVNFFYIIANFSQRRFFNSCFYSPCKTFIFRIRYLSSNYRRGNLKKLRGAKLHTFLTALIISLIRGTPCVIFIDATPAKWNVLRVICVDGSPKILNRGDKIRCKPMLVAAIAPTAVPGSVMALLNLVLHSSMKPTACLTDSDLYLIIIVLKLRFDLKK